MVIIMTTEINGTMINYYFICKTKLWLFSHNIQLEDESDNVKIGKQLHQESYKRDEEQLIDNLISMDFIRKVNNTYEIHEVKKTNKMKKAHKYQLLYYMYYLSDKKDFKNIQGVLNYPLTKQTEKIELSEKNLKELEEIKDDIQLINSQEMPKPLKAKICYKCAYYEFCFI